MFDPSGLCKVTARCKLQSIELTNSIEGSFCQLFCFTMYKKRGEIHLILLLMEKSSLSSLMGAVQKTGSFCVDVFQVFVQKTFPCLVCCIVLLILSSFCVHLCRGEWKKDFCFPQWDSVWKRAHHFVIFTENTFIRRLPLTSAWYLWHFLWINDHSHTVTWPSYPTMPPQTRVSVGFHGDGSREARVGAKNNTWRG